MSRDHQMRVIMSDATGMDKVFSFEDRLRKSIANTRALGVAKTHGRIFQRSLCGKTRLSVKRDIR